MIRLQNRRDQTIAVFGLGSSGIITARALAAAGVDVLAWDDSASQRKKAKKEPFSIQNLYSYDFSKIDTLVLAPGVPYKHISHPIAQKAQAACRPILGDIELLIEACPTTKFIGVTGTNGKSTTTALIGQMLQTAGIKNQIGGNLGPPALGLNQPSAGEIIVLELSSYQLDLTRNATLDIAVFLNMSPDHLDRHGDMEEYFCAKRRIFRDRQNITAPQFAVIGTDEVYGSYLYSELSAKDGWTVYPISISKTLPNGFYVKDGSLYNQSGTCFCDLKKANNLPGIHNWQNAAASAAVGYALGIKSDIIADAITNYHGLPHRMENLGVINGVTFINDSKATNSVSAARALACHKNIYWIAGGLAKNESMEAIKPYLTNIQHAFLIGDAAGAFEAELGDKIEVTQCGDLETATQMAYFYASKEYFNKPTVLLSPACASFDQWQNFEVRGEAFKNFVASVKSDAK
ncbi:MAG: UDP-N-acetylmuramoyl-L-alanine--D-glutamate ligase [Legionellales bacterium]|nr:UDP-N-acetylmuramoyl-L-alanine--D-glutamate ligase [Legionellales bacterium]